MLWYHLLMDKQKIIGIIKEAAKNRNILVAIDGMSASGKTTFAEELRTTLGCALFHMDDFFIPLCERTSDSGNIDFKRIKKEVLPYLFGDVHYRKFSCVSQSFSEAFEPASSITIIEGAYSLHPSLALAVDISVFMEISEEEQLRRLKLREGENISAFTEKWLPMERAYFSEYDIKAKCDIIMTE